jgi:hypothetical protein
MENWMLALCNGEPTFSCCHLDDVVLITIFFFAFAFLAHQRSSFDSLPSTSFFHLRQYFHQWGYKVIRVLLVKCPQVYSLYSDAF